jgi:hypothetical protein
MMKALLFFFDILAISTALVAAWFWYKASQRTVRRMVVDEVFDFHDMNRVIVAYNRGAILNRRAAIATAVSVLCLAAKLAADMISQLLGLA